MILGIGTGLFEIARIARRFETHERSCRTVYAPRDRWLHKGCAYASFLKDPSRTLNRTQKDLAMVSAEA